MNAYPRPALGRQLLTQRLSSACGCLLLLVDGSDLPGKSPFSSLL